MTSEFPKACACGLEHDRPSWRSLALRGVQRGLGEDLELRNCACGSTLAIVVAEEASPVSERRTA